MDQLVISQWNVNKRWNNDLIRIEMLKLMDNSDIILLQEPFGNNYNAIGNINIPKINGYDVIYNKYILNNQTQKIYAKTLIYIKNNINYNPIEAKFINNINHNNPILSTYISGIQIYLNNNINKNKNNINHNKLNIFNIYRSPHKNNYFNNQLNTLKKYTENKSFIICGDINIWHENIGSPENKRTIYTKKYQDGDNFITQLTHLNANILNDKNKFNTYHRNGRGMKIDDITAASYDIINNSNWYTDESTDISDHYRIIIKINLNIKKEYTFYKIWRINNKTNWNQYYNKISYHFKQFLINKKNNIII